MDMALATVEPQTGFVPALVGGRDFGQGQYAEVNFALGGCDASAPARARPSRRRRPAGPAR